MFWQCDNRNYFRGGFWLFFWVFLVVWIFFLGLFGSLVFDFSLFALKIIIDSFQFLL